MRIGRLRFSCTKLTINGKSGEGYPGTLPLLYSQGEAIQQSHPQTKVVKTLNMVNCGVMVDALKCDGDLGGITHAQSTEMMLPIGLSTSLRGFEWE